MLNIPKKKKTKLNIFNKIDTVSSIKTTVKN